MQTDKDFIRKKVEDKSTDDSVLSKRLNITRD